MATAASSAKLTAYRGKRDFARTPEPSGSSLDAQGQSALPVRGAAAPGQADCTTTSGSKSAACSRAGPSPRDPTLDPAVKRAAVHVEDHPIEYLDFEGVIPSGQYGSGDVIVWDYGTWEPHGTDDPAAAVAAGELHADMHGHKLRGRLILVRRGSDRSGQEQWLLLHKRDEYAVSGWEPGAYPRSVLSGRTNDEVKADPARLWRSDLPPAQASVAVGGPAATADLVASGPAADELDALDNLGPGGTWEVFGRRLRLTNLDKVLFPPADGQPPVTKREFIRYSARMAPVVVPYLAGRALNMRRFPSGAGTRGFWHKELPDHAPDWISRWDNPDADPGESRTYLVVDEAAALVWAANFGALEWHAWTSRTDQPQLPTYALIDIDPGPATSWDDVLVLARLHRVALQHLDVAGPAQGHRATGHPDLDSHRPRPQLRGNSQLDRGPVPRRRRSRARAGELGMERARARSPGPARLHPECHQQDARRPLQSARGGQAPPSRRRSNGTSSTIRPCGRTRSPSGTSRPGWLSEATHSGRF